MERGEYKELYSISRQRPSSYARFAIYANFKSAPSPDTVLNFDMLSLLQWMILILSLPSILDLPSVAK